MATWTAADLRNSVLERLGIKMRGQGAAAEDAKVVDDIWISLHDQFLSEQLVTFNIDVIEEWAQQPLTKILALEAAPAFGYFASRFSVAVIDGAAGMRELQKQAAGKRRKIPIQAEYM